MTVSEFLEADCEVVAQNSVLGRMGSHCKDEDQPMQSCKESEIVEGIDCVVLWVCTV